MSIGETANINPEIESTTSIMQNSETDQQSSRPLRPKKLSPLRHKPKSINF